MSTTLLHNWAPRPRWSFHGLRRAALATTKGRRVITSTAQPRSPDRRTLDRGRVVLGQRWRFLSGRSAGIGAGIDLDLAFAEFDAADLAGDGLGQLGDELDLARVLEGGGHPLAVVLQLPDEFVRRGMTRCEDHERLHDLPPVRSGLPTTAASATAVCSTSADSTSNGPIR